MTAFSIEQEDEAMRRRAATAIAQLIAPAIQEALASIPSFVVVQPVVTRPDKELLEAADQIARAIQEFDQHKFSAFNGRYQTTLERAARNLKGCLDRHKAKQADAPKPKLLVKETSNGSTAR